jgi:hypothetical protein
MTYSRQPDSNRWPKELQSSALPTELCRVFKAINFKRCRQDSNLCGQSPIDFKSISLTTRTRHQIKVPLGFEPRTTDSKSAVITKLHYRTLWSYINDLCTQWGSNPRGLTPTRTWVWRLRPLGHACFKTPIGFEPTTFLTYKNALPNWAKR